MADHPIIKALAFAKTKLSEDDFETMTDLLTGKSTDTRDPAYNPDLAGDRANRRMARVAAANKAFLQRFPGAASLKVR